jgi:hypothetical protein
MGIAAAAAYAGAVALAHHPVGKVLADANIALTAIAVHEHSGHKAAHVAGTTSAVLTNKAKAIAAHGETPSLGCGADVGEDRLISEGARIFGS